MEEFKGDKRTKAYKEWKAKFELENESKSKGLGDTVEKITKATGIKSVVKAVFGDDCGCDERKSKLNSIMSYNVVNCLEEDEYSYISDFVSLNKNRVTMAEQRRLLDIYNRVFNQRKQMSNCSSCIRSMVGELNKLIVNYK
jgi:hypothetical protein|tara:strand:+ start:1324 stop:1746 length:423 start_codon:yes stop_codon:yes gene_type:complete